MKIAKFPIFNPKLKNFSFPKKIYRKKYSKKNHPTVPSVWMSIWMCGSISNPYKFIHSYKIRTTIPIRTVVHNLFNFFFHKKCVVKYPPPLVCTIVRNFYNCIDLYGIDCTTALKKKFCLQKKKFRCSPICCKNLCQTNFLFRVCGFDTMLNFPHSKSNL